LGLSRRFALHKDPQPYWTYRIIYNKIIKQKLMAQSSQSIVISGFTFARNAIKYDYPLKECLNTLLAICDEVVVIVGDSEDQTSEVVGSIKNSKLKIIQTKWDESQGYKVLSQQTNIAMNQCSGKWGLYLQCDEIIHENYFEILKKEIEEACENDEIEGLLFNYKHFYASYNLCHTGRRFYRNEVRAIKLGLNIESYNDAKGFRRMGRKLAVKAIPVEIYHYGYVRNPIIMKEKSYDFHKLWHDEEKIKKMVSSQPTSYQIENNYDLVEFKETHPAVMNEHIRQSDWSALNFQRYLESREKTAILRRVVAFLEQKTWMIGYNKPYRRLIN
jgi:glycosyltransferase involved in cell wall biosynthesis